MFINTTQLYSNLVTYMETTTYLCLVLVVPGSPKVSRVRLASLYFSYTHHTLHLYTSVYTSPQLSKHSPFIDPQKTKEDQHMVTKTKSLLCWTEAGISSFAIFGKDASG